MSVLENTTKLYQMMGQGQMMEAFEEFYADNVVVQEANGDVRNGKEAQRAALGEWAQSVKEHHAGGVGATTANEESGTACVESWADVTFQDGNRIRMEEVAVQKWENGKIVHERFYYNMPGM